MKHNMKKPKGMKRGGAGKMPMKEKDGKMVPAFLKKGGPTKEKAAKKAAAKKKAAPKKSAKKAAKKMSYGGKTMKAKGMARGGKAKGMMYGGKPVYKSRMT